LAPVNTVWITGAPQEDGCFNNDLWVVVERLLLFLYRCMRRDILYYKPDDRLWKIDGGSAQKLKNQSAPIGLFKLF